MIRLHPARLLLVAALAVLTLSYGPLHPLPAAASSLIFTVNSTADAPDATPGDGLCASTLGPCTLRAAAQEADAQPSGSVITISVPAGHYVLTLGALDLTANSIVISGAGVPTTTIDGNNNDRVFSVAAGAHAALDQVMITGGKGSNGGDQIGGGILNAGALLVRNSTVVSNTTGTGSYPDWGRGGGIGNTGSLFLRDSAVVANSAAMGGGIYNSGTALLLHSRFSRNAANLTVDNGGGIDNEGTLTVTSSLIDSNLALFNPTTTFGGQGGGIYNGVFSTLTLLYSAVVSNTSTLVSSMKPTGGGIFSLSNNTTTISGSAIDGNVAGSGGGIFDEGDGAFVISGSTIDGNTTGGDGGGIYDKANIVPITITNSSINGNSADRGGAIFNWAMMSIVNSTISGNSSRQDGAIMIEQTTNLNYDTIAANGIGVTAPGGANALGTIIAGSGGAPGCSGTRPVYSLGYNLDNGASCGFDQATDITNTNPLLGPLANNGGPTATMALLPGSPAIDHGGSNANGCPATDQREVSRPQGPACDIGAYELVPPTAP